MLVTVLEVSPFGDVLLVSTLLESDLLDQLGLELTEHLMLLSLNPELLLLELSLLLCEPSHEVTVLLSVRLHDLLYLLPVALFRGGHTLQLSPVLFQTLHDLLLHLLFPLLLPLSALSLHVAV